MDQETARDVLPDPSVSKGLEYASYGLTVVAAAIALMENTTIAIVLVGAAILLYQNSQYRQVIYTLQSDSDT